MKPFRLLYGIDVNTLKIELALLSRSVDFFRGNITTIAKLRCYFYSCQPAYTVVDTGFGKGGFKQEFAARSAAEIWATPHSGVARVHARPYRYSCIDHPWATPQLYNIRSVHDYTLLKRCIDIICYSTNYKV